MTATTITARATFPGGEVQMPKIVRGTVTIDGQVYKAFEMFARGPWKVVQGTKHSDITVASRLPVKTGKAALELWMASILPAAGVPKYE